MSLRYSGKLFQSAGAEYLRSYSYVFM